MDAEMMPPPPAVSPFIKKTGDLYGAIEEHDCKKVNEIIQSGRVDPNRIVVGMDMSLLHLAVGLSENSPEIVRAFLRTGGNPNNVNCADKLSPLHLSVMYDYDEIFNVLLIHGGDPHVPTGDGKSCFDIALDNRTNSMDEKCFTLLSLRYGSCRMSLKNMDITLTEGLTDITAGTGYYTCDSSADEDAPVFSCKNSTPKAISNNRHSSYRKFNRNHSYLMTDDESNGCATDTSSEAENDKLTTINEDTELYSISRGESAETDILSSASTCTLMSCANSTPPLLISPTREQLERLQNKMQKIKIPVTPTTYQVLARFEEDHGVINEMLSASPFSNELQQVMHDLKLVNDWGQLKINLLQSANASPTKRTCKSFYNYVLLDPKIIKRANFSGSHLKSGIITNTEKFEKFLSAIFYIGKGCGKRPIQHLVEAKAKLMENKKKAPTSQKMDKILEIWKTGLGVIVVSVFHHSSEREANVNEAAMIDARGLVELSNLKKGSYTGTIATQWSQKTRNQFGSFLLYKCFCSFAVSDPKYFFPCDV